MPMKISRRGFVHAGCVAATAAAFSLSPVQRAEAAFHGSQTTSFNGGKSLLTPNFMGGGQYEFVNLILASSGWLYGNGPNRNNAVEPQNLDANGMPNNPALTTGFYTDCSVPPLFMRPGNYVLRTVGSGTISANGTGSPLPTGSFTGQLTSGVLTVSSLTGTISKGQSLVGTGVTAGSCIGNQLSGSTYQINNYLTGVASTQTLGSVAMTSGNGSLTVGPGVGRYVFQPSNSGNFTVDIGTIGTPHISTYALMHVNDEALWIADPLAVGTQFLNVLKQGNWGVFRDLNWLFANNSNVTTWATRKPQTYFCFGGGEYRNSITPPGGTVHSSGGTLALSSLSWAGATFTGSVSNGVLTVASGLTGTISVGAALYGSNIGSNAAATSVITSQLSGTTGGIGTYAVTNYQTISSQSLSTGMATAVTSSPHGQSGNFNVSIDTGANSSGSNQNYNGNFTGLVVNATTFTIPMPYTPLAPITLGTANIGILDYSITFNDPIYGNGAPQDKQTIHVQFDHLANAVSTSKAYFQGNNTVVWQGHPFVGGEQINFAKLNINPPEYVGGIVYYVLSAGLVPGVSFQFSASLGGPPFTFIITPATLTGCSISGGVLTVGGGNGLVVGSPVLGTGVNSGTIVTAFLSGSGAAGTYQTNGTQTLSGPLTMTAPGTINVSRIYTINLNGTGAVPILTRAGGVLIPSINYGTSPTANIPNPVTQYGQSLVSTVVYDATLGYWLIMGGGINNGMAPEAFLKICAAMGAHPHNCIPQFSLDNPTDYAPMLANYIKTTYPWMYPRFEPANEVWNNLQPVTTYAWLKSYVYWQTQFTVSIFDQDDWYGMAASILGQLVNPIYGTGASTVGNHYRVLIGVQTVSFATVGSTNPGRFQSTKFVNQTQAAPASLTIPALSLTINFAKDAANKWCTHALAAPYLNPSSFQNAQAASLAATYIANGAQFSGLVTSGVLTVSSSNFVGFIQAGDSVTDRYAQVPPNTSIVSQLTGTTGGAGTYQLNSTFTTPGLQMYSINATGLAAVNAFTSTFGPTTFTGSLSGGVLTVSGTINGNVSSTSVLSGAGVTPSTTITGFISGINGAAGTYQTSGTQTLGATAMQSSAANYNNGRILQFFTNLSNYVKTLMNGAGNALGTTCYEGGFGPDYTQTSAINAMYQASKFVNDQAVALTGGTLSNGQVINGMYNDLANIGVDNPAAFNLGGTSNPWSVADPDVWATPQIPALQAIEAFN